MMQPTVRCVPSASSSISREVRENRCGADFNKYSNLLYKHRLGTDLYTVICALKYSWYDRLVAEYKMESGIGRFGPSAGSL